MQHAMAVWMVSIGLIGIGSFGTPSIDARELGINEMGMLSIGMTEAEVVARVGQPDRRLDQFEPSPLSQRLVSYQYIWGADTNKGEWTTTVTFSSNTNKVTRIDRDRK